MIVINHSSHLVSMLSNIFYNIFSLVLISSLVFFIFYKIQIFVRKPPRITFLADVLILLGIASSALSVYFSCQSINSTEMDLYKKIGLPEYQVQIKPKSYPFQNETSIVLSNKDSKFHQKITIVIESRKFNSDEMAQVLLKDIDQINLILNQQ